MYYRNFIIPADVESYMEGATPEDKRRLLIVGAMRTAGVIERVHTTHLKLRITVFRFVVVVPHDNDEVKDLVREWLLATYGISEATFHQDQNEQRNTTPDRSYFHCRGTHRD